MDASTPTSHWLHRLSKEQWLAASRTELLLALRALRANQRRRGVTYARRAGGMALNALLCVLPREGWGRSYLEHLEAVAEEEALPEVVREAARELATAPLDAPRLIRLGGGPPDESLASAAATLIDWATISVEEGRWAR